MLYYSFARVTGDSVPILSLTTNWDKEGSGLGNSLRSFLRVWVEEKGDMEGAL